MSECLILPNGPLGHIARRPRNIDPPDFRAAVKAWRSWRNVHPITRLDAWLWEREKNRLRKIWHELTPRQRRWFIDRRADIGRPIVEMRPFKGFKYQRGMLSGMATRRAVMAGVAETLALDTAANIAVNIDFSPPSALDAGFGIQQSGFHSRTNSGGTSNINTGGDWVTPRNATIGNGYEVIWNQLTGSTMNDESYTEDIWATITTERYVGMSRQVSSSTNTFEIDIGVDGAEVSDVNQNYSVEAGDLV